jgi:hypothetical protein
VGDRARQNDLAAEETSVAAAKLSVAQTNQKHVRDAVRLLRNKKLSVAVLSEESRDAFLQYNKIAKALLAK